jgi:deazaflavin-dependent oxidoreductase (nitroreductase family)
MLSDRTKARIEHEFDARSVRVGVWLYRRTRGRLTRPWRRRALILTSTGRRSGLPRTVLVQFFPDGQDMLVVAANGGAPHDPYWYLNLKANPSALVGSRGGPCGSVRRSAPRKRRHASGRGSWPRRPTMRGTGAARRGGSPCFVWSPTETRTTRDRQR